jgi:Na+-driven multidrug efflux pump
MIEGLLLRLLIGVLVYWIGEKILSLIKNAELVNVLNIVLIVAVVLYVIFGSILPIR